MDRISIFVLLIFNSRIIHATEIRARTLISDLNIISASELDVGNAAVPLFFSLALINDKSFVILTDEKYHR